MAMKEHVSRHIEIVRYAGCRSFIRCFFYFKIHIIAGNVVSMGTFGESARIFLLGLWAPVLGT